MHVRAQVVKECLANIACKVIDIFTQYTIVVLQGIAAYFDSARTEKRMFQAVGNGAFIVEGHTIDRKKMLMGRLPNGIQTGAR